MRNRSLAWLLALALCAGCMGGEPPPPPTRAGGATAPATDLPGAAPTASAATAPATQDFAPATAGPPTPSPLPDLTATAAVTAPTGLITSATALSLTQAAAITTGQLDQVSWSPEGGRLAAAGEGGVILYDAVTLTATQTLTVGQWATSVAFDPAGGQVAVGTVGAIVQVWDLAQQEPVALLTGPGTQVAAVAYQPGGRGLLASLGVDNLAHLWDLPAQQYRGWLGAGLRPANALAFSRDGAWLATAEGDQLLVWDVDAALISATPVPRHLPAPASRRGAITAVAFSPTRDQLAAANTSGTIELWAPTGTRPIRALAATNTPAQTLAYSPDGALLASAHHDRALRVWDLTSGALLVTLTGHTDAVTSLAFSPDGARLASSSRDATLRLWGVP